MSSETLRATKILTTMGTDIYVDRSFYNCQNLVKCNLKSWDSCNFQSYLTWERRYALFESSTLLSQLHKTWKMLCFSSTVGVDNRSFQSYKILSTVGVDIPIVSNFYSTQNDVNVKNWHSCSFQSHLTLGRPCDYCQLSQLRTVAFRAT